METNHMSWDSTVTSFQTLRSFLLWELMIVAFIF